MHYHLNVALSASLHTSYLQCKACSWQLLLFSAANISDISDFAVSSVDWHHSNPGVSTKRNQNDERIIYQFCYWTFLMITITKLTNFLILISSVDSAAENLPCQSRADTWKSRPCVTSPPLNSQCRGMHPFLYLSYCLRGWKKSIHSLKPTLAKPPSHTWLDFPI